MKQILTFLLSVIFLVSGWTVTWARDVYEFQDVDRIVAIGDLHGDFEAYVEVMESAGLRNMEGKWVGGKTHLVQTGDITDRGPDSKKILDDLKKLAKQAKKAGGRVHILLGNHEMMNMLGDLRYVHPGEYEAFRKNASKRRQQEYYQRSVAAAKNQAEEAGDPFSEAEFREEWYEAHPLGFVEHRLAWSPGGRYYKWALKNPAMIKINDTLFLHAGISPDYADLSIAEFNEEVHQLITANDEEAFNLLFSENGLLWYRGLAENDEEIETALVDQLLENLGAERIIIGHTPTGGYILPRFGARVIVNDVGIGEYYGSNRGFLLFENGQWYGVHWGETIPLPSEDPTSLLDYLTKVSAISPDPYWVEQKIQELECAAED